MCVFFLPVLTAAAFVSGFYKHVFCVINGGSLWRLFLDNKNNELYFGLKYV